MNQPTAEQTRWIHANGSSKTVKLEELYPYAWQTISAEECLKSSEPTEGAIQSALFKLMVGEFCPAAAGEVLRIMASDIEFINPEGERQHRLDREELTADLEAAAYEKILALYAQGPFSVTWILAYALQDYEFDDQVGKTSAIDLPKIIELEMRASFQRLTAEEVKENYLPKANTWIKLIELAKSKGLELSVKNRGQEVSSPINQPTAELMIKDKVLPPALFGQLVNGEGEVKSHEITDGLDSAAYQQIAVSLLGLSESNGT